MKHLFIFIFSVSTLAVCAQDSTRFDGHKWQAPYTLAFPTGWDVERFLIPIEFAPSIPYKGMEDIRFTPGWGKAGAEDYWSYAFLWFLDGSQVVTAKTTEKHLNAYYTGLVGRNIIQRKIANDKLVTITTSFQEIKKEKEDISTFRGSVHMLDYMEQKPITLNSIVHVRKCPGVDKTFVFTEISPQPYTHDVWKKMNDLWTGFNCNAPAKN